VSARPERDPRGAIGRSGHRFGRQARPRAPGSPAGPPRGTACGLPITTRGFDSLGASTCEVLSLGGLAGGQGGDWMRQSCWSGQVDDLTRCSHRAGVGSQGVAVVGACRGRLLLERARRGRARGGVSALPLGEVRSTLSVIRRVSWIPC
jgi:hypothetical protein